MVSSRATREFEAFAAEHGHLLLRAAEHLSGDVHDAQDLLQTTLTKVYVSWSSARRGNPYLFTRRVLVNAHTDSWRRRRWREETVADPSDTPTSAVADSSDWVADRDALTRALATLSPRERAIVILRYLEDMFERDVADLLGISTGTVKSTTSRALQRQAIPFPPLTRGAGVSAQWSRSWR